MSGPALIANPWNPRFLVAEMKEPFPSYPIRCLRRGRSSQSFRL